MLNASRSLHILLLLSAHIHASVLQTLPFEAPLLATLVSDLDPNHHDIFRRDTTCQKGYLSCDYMGLTGYCCPSSAQCAIDGVGHVACCPVGAVCVGTVNSGNFATQPQQSQQTTNYGSQPTASPAIQASYVPDSSTGAFVVNTATASYVPNSYFPFKVIPTTYANAASCSSAWTGCQTDLSSCTNYLGGSKGGGVSGGFATISAPNFISTSQQQMSPAPTIFAAPTAESICRQLSSVACSGLEVTACSVFGNGVGNAAPTKGCNGVLYGAAGMGIAVAGFQWF